MNEKRVLSFLLIAVLAMMLLVGCGPAKAPASEDAASVAETQGQSGEISVDDAKDIALNHSGVASADAQFVRADYEWDEKCYEIEFYADNVEYDYEIDAVNGDIRSYDSEIEGFVIGDDLPRDTAVSAITEDEAKAIALKHAGFQESEVKALRVTRDFDDGNETYEVEFRDGFTEYSYDISAADGEILSYEIDND